jgi:hypothetical protein
MGINVMNAMRFLATHSLDFNLSKFSHFNEIISFEILPASLVDVL